MIDFSTFTENWVAQVHLWIKCYDISQFIGEFYRWNKLCFEKEDISHFLVPLRIIGVALLWNEIIWIFFQKFRDWYMWFCLKNLHMTYLTFFNGKIRFKNFFFKRWKNYQRSVFENSFIEFLEFFPIRLAEQNPMSSVKISKYFHYNTFLAL